MTRLHSVKVSRFFFVPGVCVCVYVLGFDINLFESTSCMPETYTFDNVLLLFIFFFCEKRINVSRRRDCVVLFLDG